MLRLDNTFQIISSHRPSRSRGIHYIPYRGLFVPWLRQWCVRSLRCSLRASKKGEVPPLFNVLALVRSIPILAVASWISPGTPSPNHCRLLPFIAVIYIMYRPPKRIHPSMKLRLSHACCGSLGKHMDQNFATSVTPSSGTKTEPDTFI